MATIALFNLGISKYKLSNRSVTSIIHLMQARRTLISVTSNAHIGNRAVASALCFKPTSPRHHRNNISYNNNNNFIRHSLPITGLQFCRYQSNIPNNDEFLKDQQSAINATDSAAPPSATELLSDAVANTNGTEVTQSLTELGLGGHTPIGILQHFIDNIHYYTGLPWWGSIVITTVILRACTLPLIIRSYRNSAKMSNISPTVSRLVAKMRAAPSHQEAALYSNELKLLFRKNDCHPFKSFISPIIQVPIFISFFLGLRRMCATPVESMREGGLSWFTDLTVADPYYILPVLSCLSMLATLELGSEVGARNTGMQQQATMNLMKIVFRILGVAMLPITAKFPTAVFCYWLTSNCCSMLQMVILNNTRIRTALGIPIMITHPTSQEEQKKTGALENFKTTYNAARQRTVIEHQKKAREKTYKQALNIPAQDLHKQNPRLRKKKTKRNS